MAHDIRRDTGTPAEELRRSLDQAERLLPDLRNNPAAATELLTTMDRIASLFAGLEAEGMDVRPERGRWDGLQRAVTNRIAYVVRSVPDWDAARREAQATPDRPWWYLDRTLAATRSRNRRRALVTVVAASALVALLVFAWRTLFPVDPAVAAAQQAMELGQRHVRLQAWEAAYASYTEAAQATPNDAIPFIWLGVLKAELGDAEGAAAHFAQAERLQPDPVRFHVEKSFAYNQIDRYVEAEAEARAALAIDPNSPHAHYVLAGALEQQDKIDAALEEFDIASQLAEQVDANLAALARIRLATLMQAAPFREATEPTPAP
jgi:tetratricopeptide (TPR) repeat protein